MNTRRTFLLSLPVAAAGAATAQTTTELKIDPVDSAKTLEEIKTRLPFDDLLLAAIKWREATFAKQKYLFAVTNAGDGESSIELHGWIYNLFFKEWRRLLAIKTRGIGNAELLIDEQKGVVSLRGRANNDLDGVEVFRFDLRATSDDAGYVH